MPAESAHGKTDTGNGRVSFSELVRAHNGPDEQRYRALLTAFEASTGEIVDAYWCRKEASAVALTRRESTRRGRLLYRGRRKLDRVDRRAQRVHGRGAQDGLSGRRELLQPLGQVDGVTDE